MAQTEVPQPFKCPGDPSNLAAIIIEFMPPHRHYVEPYFGGSAVLLDKDPIGISEVINDVYGVVTNFFDVLKGPRTFEQFQRINEATPFSQTHSENADELAAKLEAEGYSKVVCAAWRFSVRCRQSRTGSFKDFATRSHSRTRQRMAEQMTAWLTSVDGLLPVRNRLMRVVILDNDPIEVIKSQDGPESLFYCDPRDPHSAGSVKDHFALEMTDDQHVLLLSTLAGIEGKLLLSGYRCELYDRFAKSHGWRRIDFDCANQMAGG